VFASHAREQFLELARRDDPEIDVLRGALLIAQEEYPQFWVEDAEEQVEAMAEKLAHLVDAASGLHNIVYAANHLFFEQLGFKGHRSAQDQPDAFLMNRVLEEHRGSVLLLSILYQQIVRRGTGIDLEAVDFPGHVLLASEGGSGALYLDIADGGRLLLADELEAEILRPQGIRRPWSDDFLRHLGPRGILARLLTELKLIYARRRDVLRTLKVVERIVLLRPESAEERRDRGILYSLSGHRMAAIADLEDYLTMRPEAADAEQVRRRLEKLLRRGLSS